MARFYFDISDGVSDFGDPEGVEFAVANDAKLDGAVALARMMADSISQPTGRIMHITIRDHARRPIARLALSLTMKDLT
jgi:glycerol-3-phosphate dehydrogenase